MASHRSTVLAANATRLVLCSTVRSEQISFLPPPFQTSNVRYAVRDTLPYFVAGLFACFKSPTRWSVMHYAAQEACDHRRQRVLLLRGWSFSARTANSNGIYHAADFGVKASIPSAPFTNRLDSQAFFPRIGAPEMAAATWPAWRFPSCQGPFLAGWHWHLETWRGAMRAPPALMVGVSLDRCFRGDRLVIFEHETGLGVSHARHGNKAALRWPCRVRLGGGTLGNGGMAFDTIARGGITMYILPPTPPFGLEETISA